MDDKAFQLIEKMYSELIQFKEDTNTRLNSIEDGSRKTSIIIEHDLLPKITALFDGHIQNTQQLERIERAVEKHEDIIIRKIK